MKKLLLILLCFPMIGFGQACQYESSTDASEICDYIRGNRFASDRNAQNALEMILNATNSSQKFAIRECSNISNAIATRYKGINYILYDKKFMDEIATNTNSWSKISILAHEIGHHVYGHTLAEPTSLAASRQMELEADEYSGFVMYQLGVNLSQAQEAVRLYASEKDDTYSTHPRMDKRLKAIEKGWNKSKNSNNDYSTNSSTLTSEDYFYKAFNNESDYQYQIDNYTKCLRKMLNDKIFEYFLSSSTYFLRGEAYYKLGYYEEAISDYNIAISIDPDDYKYKSKGDALKEIGNYQDAISNFSKAIMIDPQYKAAYVSRAFTYEKLGQLRNAISDYTSYINLSPYEAECYFFRGFAQVTLNNKKFGGYSSCNDFKRACELDQNGIIGKEACKLYYQTCNR